MDALGARSFLVVRSRRPPTLPSAALAANATRNGRGDAARAVRWAPVRDAVWELLEPQVRPGARVAVVGAGNAHDLPLAELAARARRVTLLDLDAGACRAAAARLPAALRARVEVVTHDVTGGAADRLVAAARAGRLGPPVAGRTAGPLPGAPYDVVVADLLYTQLLYPALLDAGVGGRLRGAILAVRGQPLTDAVVAALHASAPDGVVAHLHDVVGWWDDHPQPFTVDEALAVAAAEPGRMPALLAGARTPRGCDLARALRRAGAGVRAERWWRWPFAPGADYLVCGVVAHSSAPD
jgi:hypothetical protein